MSKIGFDRAETETCEVCLLTLYRSPRLSQSQFINYFKIELSQFIDLFPCIHSFIKWNAFDELYDADNLLHLSKFKNISRSVGRLLVREKRGRYAEELQEKRKLDQKLQEKRRYHEKTLQENEKVRASSGAPSRSSATPLLINNVFFEQKIRFADFLSLSIFRLLLHQR